MPGTGAPESTAALELGVDRSERVSLSTHVGGVPPLHLLRVENTGAGRLSEILVWAELEGFSQAPWTGTIPQVSPGETFNLARVALRLDPEALRAQTERAEARLVVRCQAREGANLQRTWAVEVLPPDVWTGPDL
ncbi:MAG: hypothetical protein KDD82_28060, partial [Planctomycetes bacterium]|nr:hypothetical protein [Planctomycetota bacterium]